MTEKPGNKVLLKKTHPGRTSRAVVVGGIGTDDAVFLPRPFTSGLFIQAESHLLSPGGSAANIATALADTSIPTILVGCVGTDTQGDWLCDVVSRAGVELHVRRVAGPTPRSLVVIEPRGERTIIGVNEDLLRHVTLFGLNIASPDVVIVPAWRPYMSGILVAAHEAGCRTVVGMRVLEDNAVAHADVVIGSRHDLVKGLDPTAHTDRFPLIVITDGADGSSAYTSDGVIHHQPAFRATPVDATGAGDAYLAGFAASWICGDALERCLLTGSAAGALATEQRGTMMPKWPRVLDRLEAS
jgi:ribokinase